MKLQCFVGHVFEATYIDDMRRAITEAFAPGFKPVSFYFADQDFAPGPILKKISDAIDSSFLCLFEVSESPRPNVFLELGYAMGKGKTCVLLAKDGASIPSDLAGFDRVQYPSWKQLTERLAKLLPKIMAHAFNESGLLGGFVAIDPKVVSAFATCEWRVNSVARGG